MKDNHTSDELFPNAENNGFSNSKTSESEVNRLAKILFDYQNVSKDPMPASAIVAFGNHDEHIAHYAAELYLKGYASTIIFSGGYGRITKHIWDAPEAVRFAEIAETDGVPEDAIIIESASSNTGENITNTQRILRGRNLDDKNLIVVERPYRALRTQLSFAAQWPNADITLCSPKLSYSDYLSWYPESLDDTQKKETPHSEAISTPISLPATGPITKRAFLSLLVGDIQRIILYGESGFQKKTVIPEHVLNAYQKLIELGYTDQMLHAS